MLLVVCRYNVDQRLSLSWQHHIVEATVPVKNKKKNKKPITVFVVNGKLFYIFPPKDLLCIVSTINILVQTEVAIL